MFCFHVPLRFTMHPMIFGSVLWGAALIWSGDSPAQESPAKEIVTPKSLPREAYGNPVASNTTPAASEIAPQAAELDPLDKFTQKLIQDALEGKPVSARNPMFQDMLDVLRSRGSVLKGSMLETETAASNIAAPNNAAPNLDTNRRNPVEPGFEGFEPASQDTREEVDASEAVDASENEPFVQPRSENRFLTAEMLLRTARQLDRMAMSSPRRKRLVNQLRQEAVILLTEPTSLRKAARP